MKKFNFPRLKYAFAVLSLLTSIQLKATPPKWTYGYPKIVNGATTADITANTDQSSSIYYVVYNSVPANVTSASIKADARAATGGIIEKNGTIINSNAGTDIKGYIKGLQNGRTYFVYVTAENNTNELQSNTEIKSFTLNLPLRQAENSYTTSIQPGMIGYLSYFPEEYYKNPTANFPILIFLHGMGEKTWMLDNISLLSRVKVGGIPMLIDQGQEFPFIVISPQCPFGDWDNIYGDIRPGALVHEVLQMAKSRYRVDGNRVYVTGLSMGGAGTISYIQNYPEEVAAAIPIAGWGDFGKACASKDVPLWIFHGSYDGPNNLINMVDVINSCNPVEKSKITVYNGVGHNAWDITYNNTGYGIAPDNIYDWLLRHSKNTVIAAPINQLPTSNAGTDVSINLPTNSVTLTGSGIDPDGSISSYSWTKVSGPSVTLGAANTNSLSLSFLSAGTYLFRLSVTDNKGAQATDDMSLIVKPGIPDNQLPVSSPMVISMLTLADAEKGVDVVSPLTDGYTLNLSTIGAKTFTVVAKNSTKNIGSISFTVNGYQGRIENYAPYSMTGNCFPNFTCYNSYWVPALGKNTVTATPYSGPNATGTKGTTTSTSFNVIDGKTIPVQSPTISFKELSLTDAEKFNDIVSPLTNNYTWNLATTGTRYYTFTAKNPSADVKSIVFTMNGDVWRIENDAPFSFTGNCLKGFTCYNAWWAPSVGKLNISATAFSGPNGTGTKGTSINLTLNVINSGTRVASMENSTSEVSASPNPFTDVLNVQLNRSNSGTTNVTLIDNLGHLVYENKVGTEVANMIQINVGSEIIKPGMYFLKIEADNGSKILKVMKN